MDKKGNILKYKLLSSLGCSLEWLDFALYGFLGPIFSKIFFAHSPETSGTALVITYLIFAMSYAARPIGSLLFGYIGDKHGRMVALKITPIAMMLTTLSMAFIPTYSTAGSLAVVLLIVNRLIQGILLGGEFTGNMVYLCESSSIHKYLWGSISSCTGSTGILLASVATSILYALSNEHFLVTYGWRLLFLLAIPLGIFTFYVRLKLKEPPNFRKNTTNPIFAILKKHKKKATLIIGLMALHASSYYFIFIFFPVFLSKYRGVPNVASLFHNSFFIIAHIILIPIFGFFIEKVGGIRANIIIAFLFSVLTIPLFAIVAYSTNYAAAILLFSALSAVNAAIIPGLLTEITPQEVRYTLLSFSFNIGFGVLGGLAPFLSILLISKTNVTMSPAIYLTLIALMTLATSLNLKKEKKSWS